MTETCICKNCTARETCPYYDLEEENDECVYEVLAGVFEMLAAIAEK